MCHWLSAAKKMARFGLPVMPVAENGKEPLLRHGVKSATTNEAILEEWANRWPKANLAAAIPPPLGVLDEDPRNGGDETLARLIVEHGPLPETVTARTGGGGRHFPLVLPNMRNTRTKLGPGLELLYGADADGFAKRYFLLSPSVVPVAKDGSTNPNGGRYVWTRGGPIALAPSWLVELASSPMQEAAPFEPSAPSPPTAFERARKYLEKVEGAVSGQHGHDATFSVAVRLVRGFSLSNEDAISLLGEWNAKCQPPWGKHDLARKVHQARAHGAMEFGELLNRPFEGRRAV